MSKRAKSLLSSLVILCLFALLLTGCEDDASREAQEESAGDSSGLRLVPVTDQMGINDPGEIEIHLDNADNLYGLQIHLRFDPTVVKVKDADPNQEGIQIVPGQIPAPDFAVRNVVDNEQGLIEYAIVQLSPRKPAQGSGTVATIRFQGVEKGASPLDVLIAKLADPNGQELPVQVITTEIVVN